MTDQNQTQPQTNNQKATLHPMEITLEPFVVKVRIGDTTVTRDLSWVSEEDRRQALIDGLTKRFAPLRKCEDVDAVNVMVDDLSNNGFAKARRRAAQKPQEFRVTRALRIEAMGQIMKIPTKSVKLYLESLGEEAAEKALDSEEINAQIEEMRTQTERALSGINHAPQAAPESVPGDEPEEVKEPSTEPQEPVKEAVEAQGAPVTF